MSEKLPENNPWSTLSTVNTFDNGNNCWTTRRVDDSEAPGGGQIVGRVGPATSLLIESLIQQLCTIFEGDTARRKTLYFAICDRLYEMKLIDGSYNMLELETVRSQYQIALYKLVTIARASTGSESPIQIAKCLMTECSRYRREFEEIGFIAAGGFGSVFKALHRLDGNEYAIKKIVVHSGRVKTIMQHLEEVKTIAKLNHTNIVSYKGAWIEPTFPETFVPNYDTLTDYDNRDRESCDVSENFENGEHAESRFSESDSTDENNQTSVSKRTRSKNGERTSERVNSRKVEEDLSDVVSFRSETQETKISYGNDNGTEMSNNDGTDDSESREETVSERRICQYPQRRTQQYATLYIQMGLCDQTLRQWMDERNQATPINLVTAILVQILCGLEYIHSCGIVHHDVKPSNIFISTSGKLQIQLGDFGLACPLQRESHPSMLGTPTYAAPEQLNGKCDPKSDVYSLGIVLLELLIPMQTWMERSRVITALKSGQIPTTIATNYPKWAQIISQLVQEDPKKRPSTSELLANLREDKDSQMVKLIEENQKKDDIIAKLKEENEKKDHMIEKVKSENSSIVIKLSNKITQLESKLRELGISLDNT